MRQQKMTIQFINKEWLISFLFCLLTKTFNNMLNEELFFDKKDLEIAKLKIEIDRFKKRDNKQFEDYQKSKEEISKLRIEIGKLKSYIDELESAEEYVGELGNLRKKIKNQREELVNLQRKLHCSKLEENRLLELEIVTKDNLSNQIKILKVNLEKEQKNNEELLSLLAKYHIKFGEI